MVVVMMCIIATQAQDFIVSHPSGFYENPFELQITPVDGVDTVQISFDGGKNWQGYSDGILIENQTGTDLEIMNQVYGLINSNNQQAVSFLVRTSLQDTKGFPLSYFVGYTPPSNVPLISILINPDSLFDPSVGIWEHPDEEGQEWERDCIVQIFDQSNLVFQSGAGIRIHGNATATSAKKSLRLYFRNEYTSELLPHDKLKVSDWDPFPGGSSVEEYHRLVLRTGGQSIGNVVFRDVFGQGVALNSDQCENLDQSFDFFAQNGRPAIVFLNGELYGMLNIRDRIDDKWLEDKLGIDESLIQVVEPNVFGGQYLSGPGDLYQAEVLGGEIADFSSAYKQLFNTANQTDFTGWSMVDIQNFLGLDIVEFVKFWVYCAYIRRGDFPRQNARAWRCLSCSGDDGLWHFYLKDLDGSFFEQNQPEPWSYFTDYIVGGANMGYANDIFISVMKSEDVRNYFINTACDLSNTILKTSGVTGIDTLQTLYMPLVSQDMLNWGDIISDGNLNNWLNDIAQLEEFINTHRPIFEEDLNDWLSVEYDTFLVPADVTLAVSGESSCSGQTSGRVVLNNVVTDSIWSGQYFLNIPIPLRAEPEVGFEFVEWVVEGVSALEDPTNPIQTIVLGQDASITAVFVEVEYWCDQVFTLAINEVCSNNDSFIADESGEFEDWFEIHNSGIDTVNLEGFYLTDDLGSLDYQIPEEFLIPPGGFGFFWADSDESDGVNHTNFKLSADGEAIWLLAPDGITIVSSVEFGPIPTDASLSRICDSNGDWEITMVGGLYEPTPAETNCPAQEFVLGCTDSTACNFYPEATSDDGTCEYPQQFFNCDGECVSLEDTDNDGLMDCDEIEQGFDPLDPNDPLTIGLTWAQTQPVGFPLLYPNPAENVVAIDLSPTMDTSEKTIFIRDYIGQILFEVTTNNSSLEFNVSDLSSGVYVAQIYYSGGVMAPIKFKKL